LIPQQAVDQAGRDLPAIRQSARAELEAFDGEGIAPVPAHQAPYRLIELHASHDVFAVDERMLRMPPQLVCELSGLLHTAAVGRDPFHVFGKLPIGDLLDDNPLIFL